MLFFYFQRPKRLLRSLRPVMFSEVIEATEVFRTT
jgi:hypothetical protein